MSKTPFVPKDSTGAHRFKERDYSGFQGPQRNLILWQCPHLGNDRYIEMYINPQGITSSNRKTITSKRTKGGFLNQYWGEELEVVNIQGNTGDGGVEAVYALFDVYRSEQLAMTKIIQGAFSGSEGAFSGSGGNLIKRRQPIGPISTSVVMWYMGEGKRGYFLDFQIDEGVQANGVFNYRATFTVVETINRRRNFMPWHRKPWSTTETPNVVSNGRNLITGGYKGEQQMRIGRLNSPVGEEKFTKTETEDGAARVTRKWVQSRMFDPKYQEQREGVLNPILFSQQRDNIEEEETTEGEVHQRRAERDQEDLKESAKGGEEVSDVEGTSITGVSLEDSEKDGEVERSSELSMISAILDETRDETLEQIGRLLAATPAAAKDAQLREKEAR